MNAPSPCLLIALLLQTASIAVEEKPSSPAPRRELFVHLISSSADGNGNNVCYATSRVGDSGELEPVIMVSRLTSAIIGKVERHDDKYSVYLKGNIGSTSGEYRGEMELEKRKSPEWFGFSGVIRYFTLVLSTNRDATPPLKEPLFKIYDGKGK